MNAETLKELEKESIIFLCHAYFLVKEQSGRWLDFRDVLDDAGIPDDHLDRIESYLSSRDYIERITAGGADGGFELTHLGSCYVEQLILYGGLNVKIKPKGESQLSDEIETIDAKSQLEEEQNKRGLFLYKVYEAADGNRWNWVTIKSVAEELGLTEQESFNIVEFLEGEYLVECQTGGGWHGHLSLTDYGIQRVQDAILEADRGQNEQNGVVKRGPNQDTEYKLNQLRQLRESSKQNGEVTKGWIQACQEVGIRPETVISHDPELRQRWDDASY